MGKFEVIYSKIIDADDFFDAIDQAQKEKDVRLLTVSNIDDEDVLN